VSLSDPAQFPRCPVTNQQVPLELGVLMATKAVRIRCPSCRGIHRLEPNELHFSTAAEELDHERATSQRAIAATARRSRM
jgi:hypothetical protein